MMSDLNMSHGEMTDFVFFPLFGFTLVIKLRNFYHGSNLNTLLFFDQKHDARFEAKQYLIWFKLRYLNLVLAIS